MSEPLSPTIVLEAYTLGAFPMADARDGEVSWYTADPRAILPLAMNRGEEFEISEGACGEGTRSLTAPGCAARSERLSTSGGMHVPRSLTKFMRRQPFELTHDQAFEQVIYQCAQPREHSPGTWINDQIIDVFCQLHKTGHAHSVEAWQSDQLVGGIYGLAIGGAFFGESMFSKVSNASKVCLVHLVEYLQASGFVLFDVQFHNNHLEQFGIIEIPGKVYLKCLQQALAVEATW